MALMLLGCQAKTTTLETTQASTISENVTLETPSNLIVLEGVLTWNTVINATGYIVRIDGTDYSVTDSTYVLPSLALNQIMVISVRATESNGVSLFSEPYYVLNFEDLNRTQKYNYSINSSVGIWIQIPKAGQLLAIKLMSENRYLNLDSDCVKADNRFTINKAFLTSLELGNNDFEVYTTAGKFNVTVTIVNSWIPYLIDDNTIHYEIGKDLIIHFELFGGVINLLSGNDITMEDYSIDGYFVTIKNNYIHQKFDSHPERTTLIISYSFTYNSDTIIGYLFIKPPLQ